MKENIKLASVSFLIMVSLLVYPTFAQKSLQVKVDEYIKSEMQKQKIPGVSLAIIRDGKAIYTKGYGYANVENQVPVKLETIFQSGSVGKPFTVMAIMILVEEGKIGLNDKLNKYFLDAPAEWSNITVRHLLTHTSGMTGYPEDFNFRSDYTEEDLYNQIKKSPLAFKPGEIRGYSNLGYVLLGILIRKVTGKFYGDFLRERIFTPLEMNTARVISEADIIANRASGYRLDRGELKNQEWVSPSINTTADGALYLSTLDMAKWEAALNGGKLLQRTSFDAMWTQIILNNGRPQPWGFSWQIENLYGKQIIEHTGGWQGFVSTITRFPEEKLAVIVLANLRGVNPQKLARGVLEIYQPELSIAGAQPIEDKEPKVTAFLKEILQKIIEKKLTPELFSSPAGNEILAYSEEASTEFKSMGKLRSIELLERQESGSGARVYAYRLTYDSSKVVLTFGLAKDDRLDSIELRRY